MELPKNDITETVRYEIYEKFDLKWGGMSEWGLIKSKDTPQEARAFVRERLRIGKKSGAKHKHKILKRIWLGSLTFENVPLT